MPLFPKRLEENPPRDGFFEHDEYLTVRAHLPQSYQDVLDFAYYSGWRRNEILGLTWAEVDIKGGVIRLTPRRSKTKTGRVLPISRRCNRYSHAADVCVRRRTHMSSTGMGSRSGSGAPRFAMRAGRLKFRIGSSTIADLPRRGT